jgi:hypothetical protein
METIWLKVISIYFILQLFVHLQLCFQFLLDNQFLLQFFINYQLQLQNNNFYLIKYYSKYYFMWHLLLIIIINLSLLILTCMASLNDIIDIPTFNVILQKYNCFKYIRWHFPLLAFVRMCFFAVQFITVFLVLLHKIHKSNHRLPSGHKASVYLLFSNSSKEL